MTWGFHELGGLIWGRSPGQAGGPVRTRPGCSMGRGRAVAAFLGGSRAVVWVSRCNAGLWASHAQPFLLRCRGSVGPSWELPWGTRIFAGVGGSCACAYFGYWGLGTGCGSPCKWEHTAGAAQKLEANAAREHLGLQPTAPWSLTALLHPSFRGGKAQLTHLHRAPSGRTAPAAHV